MAFGRDSKDSEDGDTNNGNVASIHTGVSRGRVQAGVDEAENPAVEDHGQDAGATPPEHADLKQVPFETASPLTQHHRPCKGQRQSDDYFM